MSDWIAGSGSWQVAANWNNGVPNGTGSFAAFSFFPTSPANYFVSLNDQSTITVAGILATLNNNASLFIRPAQTGTASAT